MGSGSLFSLLGCCGWGGPGAPVGVVLMAERPYRPSSGSEGMDFREEFCFRCKHDIHEDCDILGDTLVYPLSDRRYPKEWVQDERGARCTAFVPREVTA
jgi:hypothetical protein